MKLLHELATQVLLGSERSPPCLPQLSGALGELLLAACPPEDSNEVRLLRYAGSLAVCAAAGYVPALAEEAPPEACQEEELLTADHPALGATLQQILADGPDPLRREAFGRLAITGRCLPPGLLPRALTLGKKTADLRPALLAVLGRRGQWLAPLNPAWTWAVGGADPIADLTLWDHGSPEQRKLLLDKVRKSDPGQARALLQDGFSQLEARERASLLESMGCGLASADEDFLETLLADRSKEVRQRAANLLACLPGSRYSTRMTGRMAACLGEERKLFRTVRTLEAPTSFGAGWKDDALEEGRAKGESLGERAWWLYQIARALPLAWWLETTGLSPAELIKWVRGTDWSEAMLRAWSEALQRQPDARWAAEFLVNAESLNLPLNIFELLAGLPVREREQHWLVLLQTGLRHFSQGDLLARLVENFSASGEEMSEEFSRRVLAEVRQLVNQPTNINSGIYRICQILPELVCLIPSGCFADAAEGWPVGRPETEYFSKTLARILAILEQRKILHQILR